MNYRHLPLQCECGEIPEHISEVGLSDDHKPVIHWWCSTCRKLVHISKPLAACWNDCPVPEHSLDTRLEDLEPAADKREPAFSDVEFLRAVGVRLY